MKNTGINSASETDVQANSALQEIPSQPPASEENAGKNSVSKENAEINPSSTDPISLIDSISQTSPAENSIPQTDSIQYPAESTDPVDSEIPAENPVSQADPTENIIAKGDTSQNPKKSRSGARGSCRAGRSKPMQKKNSPGGSPSKAERPKPMQKKSSPGGSPSKQTGARGSCRASLKVDSKKSNVSTKPKSSGKSGRKGLNRSKEATKIAIEKTSKARKDRWKKAVEAITMERLLQDLGIRQEKDVVCPYCKDKSTLEIEEQSRAFRCKSCKRDGTSVSLVKRVRSLTEWQSIAYMEKLANSDAKGDLSTQEKDSTQEKEPEQNSNPLAAGKTEQSPEFLSFSAQQGDNSAVSSLEEKEILQETDAKDSFMQRNFNLQDAANSGRRDAPILQESEAKDVFSVEKNILNPSSSTAEISQESRPKMDWV